MESHPSFLSWLSVLLVGSFLMQLLLPLLPVLPGTQAEVPPKLSSVTASANKLDQLFAAEQDIVAGLEQFVQLTERSLQHAKRYLELYHSDRPLASPSNPVRDYKLLQRVESSWNEELSARQLPAVVGSIDDALRRFVGTDGGVGQREAVETITALLTVQEVYDVDITEMAEGRLLGLDAGTKLTLPDIEKMSTIAIASRAYKHGLVWLEAGVKVANKRNDTAWAVAMDLKLMEAARKHDALVLAKTQGYSLFPSPLNGRSATVVRKQMESDVKITDDMTRRMHTLCRGQDLRNQSVISTLHCFYEAKNPYFYLQPLKTEVQSYDPYICVYHDFLRPEEVETLMEISRPNMTRSEVGSAGQAVGARVSSSYWLSDSDHHVVAGVSRRTELTTGLDTTNRTGYPAERLQVCEYGTGGYFMAHHDFLGFTKAENVQRFMEDDPEEVLFGDRIATLMIYLSPVLRGGRTVFPELGVTVEPLPGSAVYWDNLLSDGSGDTRTLHSGCPVAFGYKWIANKFIRSTAQAFRRPYRSL